MSETTSPYIHDEDIKQALFSDRGAGATLISWELEDFTSKFDGNTSLIKNARVKYTIENEPKEVCYVIKANTGRGQAFHYFYGLIFAKEVNFYREVIPLLNSLLEDIGCIPLSFPKCLHSRLEKGNDLVILENLREQNYSMEDKTLGVDVPHASLVLKELAKLHASSTLLQARTPDVDLANTFKCLEKEWTREFNLGSDFGSFVDGFLDIALAMFEKFGDCETIIKWIKKVRPNVWKMYDAILEREPPFAVILHGDCWINNLLFKYDVTDQKTPIEVKLLDVQGCRKGSLALDLHHFINLNVKGPERREHLSSLLATYHASFGDVMRAGRSTMPFTLEELRQEYTEKGFYGVLYSIMWLPNMVRRPHEVMDILENGKTMSQKENVLWMVDNNPLLKTRIMSVMEEWMDHGLFA